MTNDQDSMCDNYIDYLNFVWNKSIDIENKSAHASYSWDIFVSWEYCQFLSSAELAQTVVHDWKCYNNPNIENTKTIMGSSSYQDSTCNNDIYFIQYAWDKNVNTKKKKKKKKN